MRSSQDFTTLTCLLSLTTCLLATACSESQVLSAKPPTNEKTEMPSESVDNYWTPERLRKAKPLELPHPSAPPAEKVLPQEDLPQKDESEAELPSGAPGEPGDAGVRPDEKNLLF